MVIFVESRVSLEYLLAVFEVFGSFDFEEEVEIVGGHSFGRVVDSIVEHYLRVVDSELNVDFVDVAGVVAVGLN